MTNDKKALGARIKSIRLELGETLETFGKRFGANRGLASAWENGRYEPSPERLASIAKLANVSVNELLHGGEDNTAINLNGFEWGPLASHTHSDENIMIAFYAFELFNSSGIRKFITLKIMHTYCSDVVTIEDNNYVPSYTALEAYKLALESVSNSIDKEALPDYNVLALQQMIKNYGFSPEDYVSLIEYINQIGDTSILEDMLVFALNSMNVPIAGMSVVFLTSGLGSPLNFNF